MLKRSIDRGDRRELVEQQLGAALRHLADRVRLARRHPDRRMRLLFRRRLHHDVLEIPELAVVREALVAGPRLQDHGERFLEALVGLRDRNAEAGKLVVPIALADAELEPPVREQVNGGGLLGEQHRVVPRQHQHRGAEPQRRGARRHPGEQVEARRHLAEAGEVMLDHKRGVVAERLGLDVVLDEVAEPCAESRSAPPRFACAEPNSPNFIARKSIRHGRA